MDRITVGYVARAHGVRGEIRVHVYDPESTALYEVGRVFVGGVERRIARARPTRGAVLLLLEGVEDRDAASALSGAPVEVARADVPLAEGEFFESDLVGCEVVDEAGAPLGRAVGILTRPPPAQDLLVVRDERVERLLPIVPEFLVSVDLTARRVVVSPPEDLPEEPLRRRDERR